MLALWVIIGSGVVVLLVAAIRKQKNELCKGYLIEVKGDESGAYIRQAEVLQVLTASSPGKIEGKQLAAINLKEMEQALESNEKVKDAELYFDNKNRLHITVTARKPVARVFTTEGNSFYIDDEAQPMPLSEGFRVKVPVFTGFTAKKQLLRKDSLLLKDVQEMAAFIAADPFWMAQVAQVDISAEKEFELVPVVGNHIVKWGKPGDNNRKFDRLFVFYKNVLSKTGFDKYKTVDVQYSGQVVATKGASTKTDTEQLRRNIEKMLQQSRAMQQETVAAAKPAANNTVPSENIPVKESASLTLSNTNPNPVKTFLDNKAEDKIKPETKPVQKETEKKETEKKEVEKKEPRAVMPKRDDSKPAQQNNQ